MLPSLRVALTSSSARLMTRSVQLHRCEYSSSSSQQQPPSSSSPSSSSSRSDVQWQHASFYKQQDLEKEMRRQFHECVGCRACFNLCSSFPLLFDLADKTPESDLAQVPSSSFKAVVDECTLCDMCYTANCPYVPPHPLNIDIPKLMLRYRAVEQQQANTNGTSLQHDESQFHWPHQHEKPIPTDNNISTELTLKPQGLSFDAHCYHRQCCNALTGFSNARLIRVDCMVWTG
jgi:ferredoxin